MNPRRRESTYAGHALHLRARRAQNVAMAIRLPCLLLLPLLATSGATAQESRSEEHTSELQSLMRISYAVFCLKKKKQQKKNHKNIQEELKTKINAKIRTHTERNKALRIHTQQ